MDKIDFLHCICKQSNLNAYRISVVNKRKEKEHSMQKKSLKTHSLYVIHQRSQQGVMAIHETKIHFTVNHNPKKSLLQLTLAFPKH